MEFEDDAFVLSARSHGESGAIVELLTRAHGRHAAHVAGGGSRRMRSVLQTGERVLVRYRARTADHLGQASLEASGTGPSALFDDPLALAGLSAAAAVAAGALPEREPHPAAFLAFEAIAGVLASAEIWPPVYVRFEQGLLHELGFGLDLSRCAATGATENLVFVSPKTGRAVSAEAGAPYADRLLPLPPFLLTPPGAVSAGDVENGLKLTAHFLERYVFGPLSRPLPPARYWMVKRLAEAGRL
jgi:DNA repair protein RecO (recombination protein O)